MIYTRGNPPYMDQPCILWDNKLKYSTISATHGADGSDPLQALGPQTYDAWTTISPLTGNAWIDAEFSSAVECRCVGIAAHNLGTRGTGVFVVQYDDGGTMVTIGNFNLADNGPALMIFDMASSTKWRFIVSPGDGSRGAIGTLFLGNLLRIPGAIGEGYVPIDAARRIEIKNSVSLGGQFIGSRIRRGGIETEATFGPVPRDFVDGAAFKAFRNHYDSGGTFFYAGCPSLMPDDVGYCWRPDGSSELRPSYSAGGSLAALTIGLAGYGA